jgi:sugar/nucleoside kinase (ribokinase family)
MSLREPDSFSGAPEFLSIGHATHDLANERIRLGGAALYSSLTAHRLGLRVAILTSYGKDFAGQEALKRISTRIIPAYQTSTFRNIYEGDTRVQYVYGAAGFLEYDELPLAWKGAEIVYLCPVLHEVPLERDDLFSESLVGVAPQGWLRTWDGTGRIRGRRWEGFSSLLECVEMVITSEQDIEGNEDLVDLFRELTPIVIVTRAEKGATIFSGGRTLTLGAYRAEERDPTGAGDCFGAAFLVRYRETRDIEEAGRFASCVGACVVEREGVDGIPTREAVEERMNRDRVACKWETVGSRT